MTLRRPLFPFPLPRSKSHCLHGRRGFSATMAWEGSQGLKVRRRSKVRCICTEGEAPSRRRSNPIYISELGLRANPSPRLCPSPPCTAPVKLHLRWRPTEVLSANPPCSLRHASGINNTSTRKYYRLGMHGRLSFRCGVEWSHFVGYEACVVGN